MIDLYHGRLGWDQLDELAHEVCELVIHLKEVEDELGRQIVRFSMGLPNTEKEAYRERRRARLALDDKTQEYMELKKTL